MIKFLQPRIPTRCWKVLLLRLRTCAHSCVCFVARFLCQRVRQGVRDRQHRGRSSLHLNDVVRRLPGQHRVAACMAWVDQIRQHLPIWNQCEFNAWYNCVIKYREDFADYSYSNMVLRTCVTKLESFFIFWCYNFYTLINYFLIY